MAPNIVALMPMKQHSERVPNKNFRLLAGRPLYCWTLSALLGSSQIARVVIDTDHADAEKLTLEISEQFPKEAQRVTVLPRPQGLRGDMVPMTSILFHDVSTLAADFYLQTHSTNPFLRTETVDQAVSAFISSQPAHDSLFSVVARRTRMYDQLGRAVNHNPAVLLRTQDLPPLYEENSCLYIFTASDLLRRHQRIGERPLLFEMSATESLDIDDEHDWDVAAAMMPGVLARQSAGAPEVNHALAAPPAEEIAEVQIAPARRCALVMAQRLRPLHGAAASSPAFDILVSAPYLLPHMKVFAPIMADFGMRAIVPTGLEERLSEEQLLAIAGSFDGAVTGDDAFTEAVFAACAPRLKCVAKWGTGIDSINLKAAAAHGCAIRNTPEAFTCPVADSSVAYVLAFARGIVANDASIKSGRWCKQPGVCLAESVVGIVGLGAVGRAVAQRCVAFGASVLAVDPVAPPPSFLDACPEVMLGSLEQILSSSQFIVLCCDLNPGSRHIINADTLASMSPGTVIINCARGPLIDEAALICALQSGHIAGAGLDVFETEPLDLASPLRTMSNVLLAPHNANSSPVSHERVHWNTLKNLLIELRVPFEVVPPPPPPQAQPDNH